MTFKGHSRADAKPLKGPPLAAGRPTPPSGLSRDTTCRVRRSPLGRGYPDLDHAFAAGGRFAVHGNAGGVGVVGPED